MNSTQQRFLCDQPEHFGQILLLHVCNGGKDPVRFGRQANMNRLEWFAHSLGRKSPRPLGVMAEGKVAEATGRKLFITQQVRNEHEPGKEDGEDREEFEGSHQ